MKLKENNNDNSTKIENIVEMNSSDYEDIATLNNIKRTLKSCIDVDKLISEMTRIIDKSKHFNFRSERAKRFINKNDPTFILNCDLLNEFKGMSPRELQRLDPGKVTALTDKITKLVNAEITSKIADFMTECVTDKDKLNNLFDSLKLPREFSDTFLTSIYIIRVSVMDNSVVIKPFR